MRRGLRQWGSGVLAVALALLGPAVLSVLADEVKPITEPELFAQADVVVHGLVLSSLPTIDKAGRITTVSTIKPLNMLKGTLPGNLIIRQLGGILPDGRFYDVPNRPQYLYGEEVLVYAIRHPDGDYQTAELIRGKYDVKIVDPKTGARIAVPPAPAKALAPAAMPIGYRWPDNATVPWRLDGKANVTGGGAAQVTGAMDAWNKNPNTKINYVVSPTATNVIHLNALSSPCGWTTCMTGSGVIGCGGAGGGGVHTYRGEQYVTITNAEVWLRAYCTPDLYDSVTTQAVLTHELGHTLGLPHPDQNNSFPRDVCIGDEGLAQMRSNVQHRTTLGADDSDAVRWLYGDGGASCGVTPPPDPPPTGTAAVRMTHPLHEDVLRKGEQITLQAVATAPVPIRWIKFSVDAPGDVVELAKCTDRTAPYTCLWRPKASGSYGIRARMYGMSGVLAESVLIIVTVP